MRIAYLTSQYPAPSHTFIRREIAGLRERGLTIKTFSIRQPPADARMTDADRGERAATKYVLPISPIAVAASQLWAFFSSPGRYFSTFALALRHRVPGVRALVFAIIYFFEAMLLARMLKAAGITHLHNHFANAAANVGLLSSTFLRLPWSLTLHGISEFDYPAGELLREKLKAARFAASVSHFCRAQAMRRCSPVDWDKLFVARCSVDTAALAMRTEALPASEPTVICVGRLSAEKGQLGLVQVFARLLKEGLRAKLCLVGDGPDRVAVETAIANAGVSSQCTLLGQRSESETLAAIAAADILVSASFMEGLPVVLMEALSLGVPAIAPRLAGIPELVEDGTTGLLYHPGDWDGLTEALRQLINNPEKRRSLADAGRLRVESLHSVDVALAPLLARFTVDGK
jgi:colanic acid/amylovoran biosynthesis glycosyltransferase